MTIGSEFSPTETGKLIEKQAENGSANGMYFLEIGRASCRERV